MKRIIRISQKKLNELLMAQMGEQETDVQSQVDSIEQEFVEPRVIEIQDVEVEFLLNILGDIECDSESEKEYHSNIVNALNQSRNKKDNEKR